MWQNSLWRVRLSLTGAGGAAQEGAAAAGEGWLLWNTREPFPVLSFLVGQIRPIVGFLLEVAEVFWLSGCRQLCRVTQKDFNLKSSSVRASRPARCPCSKHVCQGRARAQNIWRRC